MTNIVTYRIQWNETVLSDNTNYDKTYNDENNRLLDICKKKVQMFSISFIGEFALFYGIFINYISCIKKTSFSNVVFYISSIFYILTIIIIFSVIKYNNCMEYYKENQGTHILYNLLMLQYISCTMIFGIFAFDYIITIMIKYCKRNQINRHQILNDEWEDDVMINEI